MSNKRKKCTAVDISGYNIFLYTFSLPALPSLMFSWRALKCLIFHLRRSLSEWIGVGWKMWIGRQGYILNIKNGIRKTFPTNIWTLRFMRVRYFSSPLAKNSLFCRFRNYFLKKSFCLCAFKLDLVLSLHGDAFAEKLNHTFV